MIVSFGHLTENPIKNVTGGRKQPGRAWLKSLQSGRQIP